MEIVKNFSTVNSDIDMCDHFRGIKHTTSMGEIWEKSVWIVPYVVIAYNEAGYNSTATCLECIVQEAVSLGLCISLDGAKEAAEFESMVNGDE
ncbi:MAG: hypothetical protein A2W23_03140 [Planctomycetes bacterium RBG_16_43_13]|nr:MAG: hypothetical protein A2W23_03140 [Planctomycetes bacterium RBG_16_43_13]